MNAQEASVLQKMSVDSMSASKPSLVIAIHQVFLIAKIFQKLNIKKVKKESDGPTKVTKLAIGKPGGVDPETDNYDTIVTVYCHKCDKNLDHTNPKVQPLIDSILLASSANDSAMVQEWELELKPCEHTLLLDQSEAKKIATKALAHC